MANEVAAKSSVWPSGGALRDELGADVAGGAGPVVGDHRDLPALGELRRRAARARMSAPVPGV